jgi:glycogen synthase
MCFLASAQQSVEAVPLQAGVRYGAVPIVTAVGGLKDLVTPEVRRLLQLAALVGTEVGMRQTQSLMMRCKCRALAWNAACSARVWLRMCFSLLCTSAASQVGYCLPAFSHHSSAADHRQNVAQLVAVVRAAVQQYGSAAYRTRQAAGMALDVSWARPAEQWEAFLQGLAAGRAGTTAHGGAGGAARAPCAEGGRPL